MGIALRARWALGWGAACAAGGLLAGCGALLGDFSVGDVAEDASRDGAAGDDGALGDGAGPSGDACPAATCDGACVDTATDPRSCGACGHDCTALPHVAAAAGVTCVAGKCSVPASACALGYAHCSLDPNDGCETDITTTSHCQSCATACPPNEACATTGCVSSCPAATPTNCTGTCTDTTKDPSHCGGCATKCPGPTGGVGGAAVCSGTPPACGVQCSSGWHLCSGTSTCASDTDATRCGAACVKCAVPANAQAATCSSGQCGVVCMPTYTNCGGACVRCSVGASCAGQQCVCPSTMKDCNGTCYDPANDPKNCGGCGVVCPSGSCINGVCTACAPGATTCNPCPGKTADDCVLKCNVSGSAYDTIVQDCGYAQPSDTCSTTGGAHCI